MKLSTEQIMRLALEMAGFRKPPADTLIHVKGRGIKKLLFGVDAGVPELLLAQRLGCDAVISHHPQGGSAVVNFYKVFRHHVDQLAEAGVPLKEAEQAVQAKMASLEVEMHTRNYDHSVSVAKLLKMPYMSIHSPLDEIGRRRMSEQVRHASERNRRAKVSDVVEALQRLPEFKRAETGIKVRVGKTSNIAGRIVVSHGAGTNGGYEVAKTYFKHGIGTLIYIHISAADLERLREDGAGNLIVTGHIASDSVGINPFISALEERGISVVTVGVVRP